VPIFVGFLCSEMSRWLSVPSISVSAVKCMLGCRELKSSRMSYMFVCSPSNIRRVSSTYR
jgi:hypothetical protein